MKDTYASELTSFNKQLSFSEITTGNLAKLRRKNIESVIIVGMGGSGLSGNLINIFRKEIHVPFRIHSHKDYGIPDGAEKKTLVIFSSFSGETEETLSGVCEAEKKGCAIAIVAGGGRLLSLAKKKKFPYASFPQGGLTPREAIGYNCYSVLSLLADRFPQSIVKTLSSRIAPEALSAQGNAIATKLKGKFPLFYAEERLRGLLDVWKTNLNETGKTFVSVNCIPEMNHNEIAAIKDIKNSIAIFFEDTDSSSAIKRKVRASELLFQKQGIHVIRIVLSGTSKQEKVWNNVILSHWTALFIAKRKRINPRETRTIEAFKKMLRK